MSKAKKKTTIALLAAATCCVAMVGVLTNSNVKTAIAKADAVEAAGNFQTLDGASIRISNNTPSGIRWKVSVSSAFQEYVASLGAYTFWTAVDTAPITESSYDDADVVRIECTADEVFEKGVWTYTAAIDYTQVANELKAKGYEDNQIEEYLEIAYGKTLYARAYVEIENTSVPYIFSETGDVARSIKGVATNCLVENRAEVTETTKSTFEKYAGVSLTNVQTEEQKTMKIPNLYGEYTMVTKDEGTTWTKEFVGEGSATTYNKLPADTYTVYTGAKLLGTVTLATEDNATSAISGLGTGNHEVGNDYYVDFVGTKGVAYRTPFRYATGVIDEADDMRLLEMTDTATEIDGYYIMKNSLTSMVRTMKFDSGKTYWSYSGGFRGTFEGNGYGWKNITLKSGSIFPIVNGGEIKNFSVTGTHNGGWNTNMLVVNGLHGQSKMSNVNVNLTASGQYNSKIGIVWSMEDTAVIENCVLGVEVAYDSAYVGKFGLTVDHNVVLYATKISNDNYGRVFKVFQNATETYFVSSSYIGEQSAGLLLGANEENPNPTKYTNVLKTAVNRYADNAAFVDATKGLAELPAGFNPELWTVDATYGLMWK